MSEERIISYAIQRLTHLTGDGFHGYRSSVWDVIAQAIRLSRPAAPVWTSEPPKEEGLYTWYAPTGRKGMDWFEAGETISKGTLIFGPIPEPPEPTRKEQP